MTQPNFWQAIAKTATGMGEAISNMASQVTKSGAKTADEARETISSVASQASQSAVETVTKTGEAIASTASQAGKVAVETVTKTGEAIANVTSQAGQAVTPIANVTGKTIGNATKISMDWLMPIIDRVDIVKAEREVKQLKEQYPNEKPSQIAHRLMLKKALLAAGTGLISNLVPGVALALAGIDFAAIVALSTELIYQIAAAYGQDLQASDRKGEILTIFSLSVGGSLAIEAGLGLLGNIPVAGVAIGISSNAAMLYALGYGACRFYEAKLNSVSGEVAIAASQAESQKYLETAIAQQTIMEQILVHAVLAGNPGKTWEQILPELQTLNLSPATLDAIATNITSPPPLETLLPQVNRDFAIVILAQCNKITQLDRMITPEESRVIETITQALQIQ